MANERYKTGDLRNRLADYLHQAWAGWVGHMLASARPEDDGSVCISKEVLEAWQRRVSETVDTLPMEYAEKTREQADEIIEIVNEVLRPRYDNVPAPQDSRDVPAHVRLGYGRQPAPLRVGTLPPLPSIPPRCEPCGNPGPAPKGTRCDCGRKT